MIRRNPTLINMTDFDVQDVRDMLAKQKADASLLSKMKQMAENSSMQAADMEMLNQLKTKFVDIGKDVQSRNVDGPSNRQ